MLFTSWPRTIFYKICRIYNPLLNNLSRFVPTISHHHKSADLHIRKEGYRMDLNTITFQYKNSLTYGMLFCITTLDNYVTIIIITPNK